MKIIAIDTTTPALALGIADGKKEYGCDIRLGMKHSMLLVPFIERAVARAGVALKDVDYYACGIGPGSFTGVRVGLSTIKGLCWALSKPIIGIPSLDSIARNVPEQYGDASIVPVCDAKRGLVYAALYKRKGNTYVRKSGYMLVLPQELVRKVDTCAIFTGDAAHMYRDILMQGAKNARFLDKDYWYPTSHALLAAVTEKLRKGKKDDLFKLNPMYLYPKECQIKTLKK